MIIQLLQDSYPWLLVAYFLIFIYLIYRDERWGIYLISAFLFSYLIRFQIWFVPLTLLEVMILTTFVIWLIKIYRNQGLKLKNLIPANYRWPIALFLLAATISIFVSPDRRAALGAWKAYFIEPILFLIVFINTIKSKNDLEKVFWALGVETVIIALFAIYQKITGNFIPVPLWQAKEHRRVNTFFDSPNAIGLLIGPIIIIYFGWAIEQAVRLRPAWSWLKTNWSNLISWILKLAILILGLLSIIFAVSRGSWFAVAGAAAFLLFFAWSKKWTVLLASLILILVILIPTSRNYFKPIVTFKVTSGDVRLILWQGSLRLLENRPVFGAGLAGFPTVYNRYRLPKHIELLLYPHNIIMNFWSELGLLGLVAVGWIFVETFRLGFKIKKFYNQKKDYLNSNGLLAIALAAALVEIIIHGLVDVPYFKNDLSVLFWLIIGLMITVGKMSRTGIIE